MAAKIIEVVKNRKGILFLVNASWSIAIMSRGVKARKDLKRIPRLRVTAAKRINFGLVLALR